MAETTQTTPRERPAGLTAYRLLVLYGQGEAAGGICVLGDEPVRLGRALPASGAGLALDQPEVSREHALIEPAPEGGFALRDLGSHNGTFVNRVRVSTRQLVHGDVIRVAAACCCSRRSRARRAAAC